MNSKSKAKKSKDTYSYKGWLNSDSFLKRAFACLGYQLIAGLLLYLAFAVVIVIIAIFIGFINFALTV